MYMRSSEFGHIKKYYDSVNSCQTAKLLPGEFYATRDNEMITTVLGSCVSDCLRDPVAKVGYAYVTNRMGTRLNGDPRDVALRAALYAALPAHGGGRSTMPPEFRP